MNLTHGNGAGACAPELFIGDFARRGQQCQLLFCRCQALEILIGREIERWNRFYPPPSFFRATPVALLPSYHQEITWSLVITNSKSRS